MLSSQRMQPVPVCREIHKAKLFRMIVHYHLGSQSRKWWLDSLVSHLWKVLWRFFLFLTSEGSVQSSPISASSLQNLVKNSAGCSESKRSLGSQFHAQRLWQSQNFLFYHQSLNRLCNLKRAAFIHAPLVAPQGANSSTSPSGLRGFLLLAPCE